MSLILDPLGRWSIIREVERDWPQEVGGRPVGLGGRPVSGPVSPPLRPRGFWSLLDVR